MDKGLKGIISGGGTGGHIFPAIAIADARKARGPDAEILFVGAEGRMEMERVPQAGYEIRGIKVMGMNRKNMLKNVKVMFYYLKSKAICHHILKEFKPDVAVGVGGYASAACIGAALESHIPVLLQEQNSYAGVTNKMLSKRASTICVAYEGMERFFPGKNIVLTGNPVRQALKTAGVTRELAVKAFGFDPAKRTILIMGGSLGARSINESVLQHLDLIRRQKGVQFIWQTGKTYSEEIKSALHDKVKPNNLYVTDFLSDMANAYKAADLVVSRAGACSISELQMLGKPAILVPSPNVAEDHQTKNAMALVNKNAAVCIKDSKARMSLLPQAVDIVNNEEKMAVLRKNILQMGRPNATEQIVDEVLKLVE